MLSRICRPRYAYLTNTARHEGRVPDKVSTIIAALRAGIGENQIE